MTSVFAMAGGVLLLLWISAGFAYRAGCKGLSRSLIAFSIVAMGAAVWPGTRHRLVAAFAEPVVVEPALVERSPSTCPATMPAKVSTLFSSRMPPNHPDPSVPHSGPHFTCHKNDAH
jgi:hypothetical protein